MAFCHRPATENRINAMFERDIVPFGYSFLAGRAWQLIHRVSRPGHRLLDAALTGTTKSAQWRMASAQTMRRHANRLRAALAE
jgi:hypothetical protein